MEYGYFPSGFTDNLFGDIQFAKKHFNFIEITLPRGLSLDGEPLSFDQDFLHELKTNLEGFKAIGHVHWGVDLSRAKETEVAKARVILDALSYLGIKVATIHPTSNKVGDLNRTYQSDCVSISALARYAHEQGIELLSENVPNPPFNVPGSMRELLDATGTGMTLDTGHAALAGINHSHFLKEITTRVRHVHLHRTVGDRDHVTFSSTGEAEVWLRPFCEAGYIDGITLEMAYREKEGRIEEISPPDWNNVYLEQLTLVKAVS